MHCWCTSSSRAVPPNREPTRVQSGSAAPSSHAHRAGRPALIASHPRVSIAYAMPAMSPSSALVHSAWVAYAAQSASRPGIWKSANDDTMSR